MSAWTPISETELWDILNTSYIRMSPQQERLWNLVRINPEKWSQESYGKVDGFWAVALLGQIVVWYNDIEDGFNCSTYIKHGEISEYWCNQDELEFAIQRLINAIEFGHDMGGQRSPPIAGVFPPAH